jgi:CelD/BcsL family acetyltransferase involved in cellulose biosynthesis
MSVSHPDLPPSLRVITSQAAWDELEIDWAKLFSASRQAAPPLHFDWLRLWWQVYGPVYSQIRGGLRIFTIWRGDQLIGGLPLYEQNSRHGLLDVRRLQFLSTGEDEFEEICPDYMNLLCLPGEEGTCVEELARVLPDLGWDRIQLSDLPDHSPLVEYQHLLGSAGDCELVPRGVCPIAQLEGGFAAYLQRLSANSRQQARRLIREFEQCQATFEIASEVNAAEFFDDLVRLHQSRWSAEGKPGCFAAPRFTEFHRSLVASWVQTGQAVLARLTANGKVVAVLYGFANGRKFDFYQSGVKPGDGCPLRSPGNLAHLLLMRELAGRGIEIYDFLRGESAYKLRLTTGHNPLVTLQLWRDCFRTVVYRSSLRLGRGIRRNLATMLRS